MQNPPFDPPYTPLEKVFERHFIVRVPTVDGQTTAGDQYFDPSYGVTYTSEAGFESRAIAGYAYQFAFEVGSEFWHISRPMSGLPNIRFTLVPLQSM